MPFLKTQCLQSCHASAVGHCWKCAHRASLGSQPERPASGNSHQLSGIWSGCPLWVSPGLTLTSLLSWRSSLQLCDVSVLSLLLGSQKLGWCEVGKLWDLRVSPSWLQISVSLFSISMALHKGILCASVSKLSNGNNSNCLVQFPFIPRPSSPFLSPWYWDWTQSLTFARQVLHLSHAPTLLVFLSCFWIWSC
jgi:hypothetical protein